MKHLQKLPRTDGDSVLLGTIVALGVQPQNGEFFASFDCNGELVTYVIDSYSMAVFFNELLFERIVNSEDCLDKFEFEFGDMTTREDIRCTVQGSSWRIIVPEMNERTFAIPKSTHR